MSGTDYNVSVRYRVDSGSARSGASALNTDLRKLEATNKAVSSSFGLIGVAAAAAFGFAITKASGALIGFNSQVEDTKLQIAGMLALTKKTNLSDQIGNADKVFANLQKRAATLPGTTAEYTKMAGAITQPIMDAGLKMKDLEDMTVSAVVGAKALGVEWQAAARDIDQALRAQFHSTDVFTGKILGSVGYKGEEGRAKFNALSAEKRAAELKRAMNQPQIQQLAAAQGKTFSGVLSTLQDTFQQVVGKVGLPLFKTITNEIVTWNKWLDQNSSKVGDIAKSLGEGLVSGFRVVKDAIGFLVQHQAGLMALGKVWLAVKVVGVVGGGLNALSSGAGSMMSRGSALMGVGAMSGPLQEGASRNLGSGLRQTLSLGGVAGNLPLIGQALALGVAFGTLINDAYGLSDAISKSTRSATEKRADELSRQDVARQRAMEAAQKLGGPSALSGLAGGAADARNKAKIMADFTSEFAKAQAGPESFNGVRNMNTPGLQKARKAMDDAGLSSQDINKSGSTIQSLTEKANDLAGKQLTLGIKTLLAYEIGFAKLTDFQKSTMDKDKAMEDVSASINRNGLKIDPESIMAILKASTDDPEGKHKTIAEKGKVNIHIARIEVQSDDPDRMAFGLIESFRDAAKNPSSAMAALREG